MSKSRIFIDTGAWIGLIDGNDQYHRKAVAFYDHIDPTMEKTTSTHVIAETYTWLRYRAGFVCSSRFLSIIQQARAVGAVNILLDSDKTIELAEQILLDYPDQKLSYVDATSMALMRSYDIRQVFGFDHHFNFLKFELLPN